MINNQIISYYSMMLIMLLSIISQSAIALSLGEINVRSHFAEPFLAEIALPSYSVEEMDSIEIHLASIEQHEAMGYTLTETTKQFHFSVKENSEGALYIEVRSMSAVKELSISFLLEVTSVNGRIIKGYDILLTPKAISEFKEDEEIISPLQQKMTTARIKNTNDSQETEAKIQHTAQSSEGTSKVKKLEGGGLEYTNVGNGESLSRIAQLIRPHKSMHMHQVMIALYNENPDAFLNHDINDLKTGVSLRLVKINEINDISPSEARDLIQQYTNKKKMTESSQFAVNSEENDPSPNRLQISSSDEVFPPDVLQQLHQEELTDANEKLKNARMQTQNLEQENKVLLERIAILESKIDETTKGLFLSDTQTTKELNLEKKTSDNSAENSLVIDSETVSPTEEKKSLLTQLKQHQTSLSFTGATILSLAFVAIRKKEKIQLVIENFKTARANKHNDNIFG